MQQIEELQTMMKYTMTELQLPASMAEIQAIFDQKEAAERAIIEEEERRQRAILEKAAGVRASLTENMTIEPVGCRDRAIAIWRINKPFTIELAESYLELAGVEQPELDFTQLMIKEWQEDKYNCVGTVLVETE